VIPVSDVDRSKTYYETLGWRLDADIAVAEFRAVQFTPPGSGCSVAFGERMTAAAPGSVHDLYLTVSDIEAARAELIALGVEVSEVFHEATPGARFHCADPSGRSAGPSPDGSYRTFATFRRPRRKRLAAPGGHEAATRTGRSGADVVLVGKRSGGCASSRRSGPRPARGPRGQGGCGVAGVVRRLPDARAGGRRAPLVSGPVTHTRVSPGATRERREHSVISHTI
jgi:predicted enzyme related to lactoylglutathione lyase